MKNELIAYLNPPFRRGNIEYKSPYMAALIDARESTGRDKTTGLINNPEKVGNWSGALAYMALIDHIGVYISKTEDSDISNKGFTKALREFTDLTEKSIYALYALRCAFAHEYSLINIGKGSKSKLLHHQFSVHRGDENFIHLPSTPWNGIRDESTYNLITSISLKRLGDLVEEIHFKILDLASNHKIKAIGELIFITYSV